MEIFGEKLKRLRESQSLSQEELAKELFVSRSAVAKWEQGRGFPNIDSLQLIAKRFNVTIDELVNDKELKVLEINTCKKLSLRKIIIIVISVIIAVILAVSAVLAALYTPRNLSFYLRIDESKTSSICLQYVEYENVEHDDETWKVVYHEKKLDKDRYAEFISEMKNLRVQPRYQSYKVVSLYSYYITCGGKSYEINKFYIIVGFKKYKYSISTDYNKLLDYFGLPEDIYLP